MQIAVGRTAGETVTGTRYGDSIPNH